MSEEIHAGAGFICVGVFGFQVAEDTDIAEKALKAVAQMKRARPWMGRGSIPERADGFSARMASGRLHVGGRHV